MSAATPSPRPRGSAIRFASLVAGLLWAGAGLAAQSGNQFNVTVSLNTGLPAVAPTSAFCRLGPGPLTFGAIVTIVCATGTVVDVSAPATTAPWVPIHGGAYRFHRLTDNLLGVAIPGMIDSYVGLGTVTSWRWVTLSDRDYLELLLGW